jgi:hypothetical protein
MLLTYVMRITRVASAKYHVAADLGAVWEYTALCECVGRNFLHLFLRLSIPKDDDRVLG